MTIVEFLNARLAEDEHSAQWALSASGSPARMQSEITAKRRIVEGYAEALRACTAALDAAHRFRPPPPLPAHQVSPGGPGGPGGPVGSDGAGGPGGYGPPVPADPGPRPPETDGPLSALWAWREALKHVAAVYRDHADYDPSWTA